MVHTIQRKKDIEFDLESGGSTSEKDVENNLYVVDRESRGAFGGAWNGVMNFERSSEKGKSGIESCSNSTKSGVDVMDEDNLQLFVDKGLIQQQLSHVNGIYVKQKTNPFNLQKPPKPPLPPTGPSLNAGDQKFVKELAELALRKRARAKKMRAVRKMKMKKKSLSSLSSTIYTNASAMIITITFFLIIIFYGIKSTSIATAG